MELQQLKYFAEVANHLHFGRAAERLHASQQSVSHQIGQLEGELGVRLFKRTTRKVELTLAGEALLEQVHLVFKHLQKGVDEAIRAECGGRGRLTIGYFGIMLYSILPSAVRLYRERYPEVEIVLQELDPHQLENKLQQGEIDIGFSVYLNDKHSELSMNWLPFSTESIVVALPKQHHLSGKKELILSDLANEPFVILNRNNSPVLFDYFVLSCRQAGFSPHIVQEVANDQAVIGLVAAGVGIALVVSCMSKLFANDITYIPLMDSMFTIQFAICRLRSNEAAQVENFAEIVKSFALLAD
ncbi:LysR family transcriptional regulator [Cohnella abietis]|uniref:LysR family transcriptional regulator n=1 Tax=Cohnella abietis TaxID=2507935 RepID=A0A3T1D453_9BACL|nr:LysR family transcriptional regulator [Cohnella abietis]BBI32818.1 LysR family transcriptional regulator [Cohnella abietis]